MTVTPALVACFILLLVLVIVPAVDPVRARAERWLDRRSRNFALIAVWLTPYLIYAVGTGDLRWPAFFRLLAICVPPVAIYTVIPVRNLTRLSWQDTIVWLWLSLTVLLRQSGGIWMAPRNLDFMSRLFIMAVAAWCWVFIRPVPKLGYRFSLSRRTLIAALSNFLCFAAVGIPAGLALHFIAWTPHWRGLGQFCIELLELFVFVAWFEELLFRGFLQTLLVGNLKSVARAQLIASLIFGLSHIMHAPVPNWRYVALASVAGWLYGQAFRQGGNLTASSLTHALVDNVWRTLFLKR